MVYLYWIGAFIVVTPLVLGLPFLSRNRVYRIATLFAGMNAGIITLWVFINLLRWGPGPDYAYQLYTFFTSSLVTYYIASLIIGATTISRYYLTSSSRSGALFSGFGSLFGVYIISLIIARLLEIFSITIKEGFPSPELLSDIANHFLVVLASPDLSLVVLVFVSAFVALNGTAAAMRISDEAEAPKDEKTE